MNVIEVKNVHKSFKIHYDKGATLKEKILFKNRNRYEEHQVLKGIDLKIEKGEVVGLIGENGCGKSTLLKLITRIIYPDQGTITVNGKVSSLLELGAGFHPDMSGRENIYTNASIFGLTKKEVDERLEEIIDFSELKEFIEKPVRTYSSGMYMRLAFSVAINVDAEILLVDEILAVGDAAFQAKCFKKLQEIKKQGTTIVIVSHDLGSIERLCDRAIWINKGKKVKDERPHDVIAFYLDSIMNKDVNKAVVENPQEIQPDNNLEKRTGNRLVEIVGLKLFNGNDNETSIIKTGDDLSIQIKYRRNDAALKDMVVGVGLFTAAGVCCYGTNTFLNSQSKISIKNKGEILITLEKVVLLDGEYTIDIALHHEDGTPYDYIRQAKKLSIYSDKKAVGIVHLKYHYTQD